MNNRLRSNLDNLQLSDIYSLMLFILYKTKEVPEYAVLSELCFLLDGSNMTRLLTYFEGKTITFPTAQELSVLTGALLLYQYINLEGASTSEAIGRLDATSRQKEKAMNLYLKILPIMAEYNINREKLKVC